MTPCGLARVVAFVSAAAVVAGILGGTASAAPWCGTPTTVDRPGTVSGRSIRVVYAFASDGADRSAERAPGISADVDEIAAWWRGQDFEREPRFDRVAFACGLQADLLVVRLSETNAALQVDDTRFEKLTEAVLAATGRSSFEKQLVYYDGPVQNTRRCGEGGGTATGSGVAIVYLGACAGAATASIAAHEMLHSMGALEASGPPSACPEDRKGHPCDSEADVLWPFVSANLANAVLDVGRNDYYGHGGSWADVQDSGWLRLVTRQVRLSLAIAGRGSVESDVPGLDCSASCETDWDQGATVTLEALSGEGQRFVRWTGGCTGAGDCTLTLAAAQSVAALFAPERFGLVLGVNGKGAIAGAGSRCGVARCARSVVSYLNRTLYALPSAGWRFTGWAGGCRGSAPRCVVPMQQATTVRARFVRR